MQVQAARKVHATAVPPPQKTPRGATAKRLPLPSPYAPTSRAATQYTANSLPASVHGPKRGKQKKSTLHKLLWVFGLSPPSSRPSARGAQHVEDGTAQTRRILLPQRMRHPNCFDWCFETLAGSGRVGGRHLRSNALMTAFAPVELPGVPDGVFCPRRALWTAPPLPPALRRPSPCWCRQGFCQPFLRCDPPPCPLC